MTVEVNQRHTLDPDARALISTCTARIEMAWIYAIRFRRYGLTGAIEDLLVGPGGEVAVLTSSVSEETDYACRLNEGVEGSVESEQQQQRVHTAVFCHGLLTQFSHDDEMKWRGVCGEARWWRLRFWEHVRS